MIDFGIIEVSENEVTSFSLPWLGSQDPDSFGNRGWSRLPLPLAIQVRRGNYRNSDLIDTLTVSIENSVTYGTDGMLIGTFTTTVPAEILRFDVKDDEGNIFGFGTINAQIRVTQ